MESFPHAIAHIDADCFFASVELLDFPHLRGKPVLLCSRTDRRGIVLAATYEARPFGIRAGTPLFKAQTLCPQATILKSHFYKYRAASHAIMDFLHELSPTVEVSSVDEAYVDLTGLSVLYKKSHAELGEYIKGSIYKKVGVTVSVGIGQTKTIAKIASDFKKPNGLTIVTPENRSSFLSPLEVERISGVGRNTRKLFNKYGIYTIGELMQKEAFVSQLLGKRGRELITELSGHPLYSLHTEYEAQKTLSHTSTFPDFLRDRGKIYDYSIHLLKEVGMKLRKQGMEAQKITYFTMKKDFKSTYAEYSFSRFHCDDESFIDIFRKVLFPRCFTDGPTYRKVGFYLPFIRPLGPIQYTLFESPTKSERKVSFNRVIDDLIHRFGKGKITYR